MKGKVFIIGLFFVTVGIKVHAYDDGDFQLWHTENQEFAINKDSRIALEEEFRFGDDADEFYYYHYDVGYAYDVNKNLTLGLNYRQVYEKKKAHSKFKEENRPQMNATLKRDLWGFKFDDRNRLEYRHFEYEGDVWRYRNKFTAKLPWKFTEFQIQPYLADEIFVDFKNKAFSRNRFYSGLSMGLTKNLKAEIYYMLQSAKNSGKWLDANVLGTKLKIAF